MAEDKTFRYGLIVLGFFLIMVGMFIMSAEKPQVYITFCTLGVLLVCVGITWSICQCYPKITFTPVDMDVVLLSDKSSMFANVAKAEKQCYSAPYTTSKEAERYEVTLPTYDQIQIKVEELGECKLDQSVPPLPQAMVTGLSQPTVQAKAEIHRDSLGKEENALVETICQPAPLASLKEDTNVTTSDDGRSSTSSLHSSEDCQHMWHRKQGGAVCAGQDCDGIEMADAQSSEAGFPHVQQDCQVPYHEDGYTSKEQPEIASLIPLVTQDNYVDDLYYGIKEETDNIVAGYESDLE